jgi:hypothetical protein
MILINMTYVCGSHKAFNFQLKCRYDSLALRYAVGDMPLKIWLGCCSEAIDSIYRVDECRPRKEQGNSCALALGPPSQQ